MALPHPQALPVSTNPNPQAATPYFNAQLPGLWQVLNSQGGMHGSGEGLGSPASAPQGSSASSPQDSPADAQPGGGPAGSGAQLGNNIDGADTGEFRVHGRPMNTAAEIDAMFLDYAGREIDVFMRHLTNKQKIVGILLGERGGPMHRLKAAIRLESRPERERSLLRRVAHRVGMGSLSVELMGHLLVYAQKLPSSIKCFIALELLLNAINAGKEQLLPHTANSARMIFICAHLLLKAEPVGDYESMVKLHIDADGTVSSSHTMSMPEFIITRNRQYAENNQPAHVALTRQLLRDYLMFLEKLPHSLPVMARILNQEDRGTLGSTVLMQAVRHNQLDIVQELVDSYKRLLAADRNNLSRLSQDRNNPFVHQNSLGETALSLSQPGSEMHALLARTIKEISDGTALAAERREKRRERENGGGAAIAALGRTVRQVMAAATVAIARGVAAAAGERRQQVPPAAVNNTLIFVPYRGSDTPQRTVWTPNVQQAASGVTVQSPILSGSYAQEMRSLSEAVKAVADAVASPETENNDGYGLVDAARLLMALGTPKTPSPTHATPGSIHTTPSPVSDDGSQPGYVSSNKRQKV